MGLSGTQSTKKSDQTVVELARNRDLRNSNLELLRIIAMIAIIAHHSVVHSGVIQKYDYLNPNLNQYFLEVWGMWGKTAINSFILISGYFLCKGTLAWQRYIKLLAEIIFYSVIVYFIFIITGYEKLTPKGVYMSLFGYFSSINNGFSASFLAFYAFVPIYNIVINYIDKKQFKLLITGLVFIMTIAQTFFLSPTMNEPIWYMTLYFIAAYIRLYPNHYTESLNFSIALLASCVFLAITSVICLIFLGNHYQSTFIGVHRYTLVSDSNKILAFIVGLSAFLLAKNMPSFTSKFINSVAAGTFGVLLIHDASSTMRRWLWQDVYQGSELLHSNFSYMVIKSMITPIIVFSVCSFIDYWRRKFLEKPFVEWINHF